MRRWQLLLGLGVGLSLVSLWSARSVQAEAPVKPVQAAALPSESDELKVLRLAAEKAKKALPSAQAAVVLEENKPLYGEDAQYVRTERLQNAVAKVRSLFDTVDSYLRARPWPDAPQCPTGMLPVPPGTFTMGDARNTSKAGQVTVAGFCMDTTEVTTAAYAACVKSGKCTAASAGDPCNAGVAGRGNHPINCVDSYDARNYCFAQGRWLPTEEEWEYAARGTDGRIYPWGNAEPASQLCWNGEGNSLGKHNQHSTCAVASFPAGNSPFGLSDMSGNVWEHTSSAGNGDWVYRGGGWVDDDPRNVPSAFRDGRYPSIAGSLLGFRCAGSPLS